MKAKIFCLVLAVLIGITVFTDFRGAAGTGGVSITMLNTKGEIQSELESMAALYESKTGVHINVIPAGSGTSPLANIAAMYSSGNPPTLAMLDTTDVVQIAEEKALDLSDEPWVSDAGSMAYRIKDKVHDEENGAVYSFPMGAETPGLIYNKTAIETTLGISFDPADYNTIEKFQGLMEALRNRGMEYPMIISKEDWSLGAHYLGIFYSDQSLNPEQVDQFITQLKLGKVDVAENAVYNGLLDTLDLLKLYNINHKDPLSAVYEEDPSYLTDGTSAFWFNGTWAWANVEDFLDKGDAQEFGIMPLPVSNDENDPMNRYFTGVGSKQTMIDRVMSTPEEQQAAKDFLNWLVYDAQGQDQLVNTLGMVPVFTSITLEPKDPLGRSLKASIDNGETVFGPMLPADHWAQLGGQMQGYLAGRVDREALAQMIQDYWTDVQRRGE